MKRIFSICVLAFATTLFAREAARLDVARRALGDGLWDVAANVAVRIARETTNVQMRATARLVELEALAGAGRAKDILARLDSHGDAADERFRYWRARANLMCGNVGETRRLLSDNFISPGYHALALRLSARAAAEDNDRAAAVVLFGKSAAALEKNSVARAENALEWARMLERFNDAPGALDVLTKEGAASVQGAVGDEARFLTAQLMMRTGNVLGGRALMESLVARGTNTDERVYVLAACKLSDGFFAAGATNEARRIASNAVARATHPTLVRHAGWTLGFTLLANAMTYEQGYKIISDLVRKYPGEAESAKAQLRLADGLLAVVDYTAAVKEYEVLLQAYPGYALSAHVQEGRAIAFTRLGRHAEAVGMFARAAQISTNASVRARCLFEQAEALAADKRFDEAASVYATVDAGDLQADARFRRADSLRCANRLDEAAKAFRALMKKGGDNAVEATLRVASLEVARGHLEQAIADYGTLLGEKPAIVPSPEQKVRALSGRGRALYRAYRFREAEADFAAVAKLRPERRDEMGFLSALCLYGDGRDRDAYAAARALRDRIPDSTLKCDLQFWLAKYEAERREWTSAITGFESCSTNAHATQTRRLDSLVRAARCAAALSDFPKVVELSGRVGRTGTNAFFVAEALVLQGEALKELARFDEAVLVFERAARLATNEKLRNRADISRADCLFAMGADDAKCYQNALEAYRVLLRDGKLTPSARLELAFKVGRTCEKLRRFEEAAEEYYTNVVLAYWDGVHSEGGEPAAKVLYDGTARTFFARAAFILADYHESRGELRQAVRMLEYLMAARVPSADEAMRRIRRLKERGGF